MKSISCVLSLLLAFLGSLAPVLAGIALAGHYREN
jgi:hypothetical protein